MAEVVRERRVEWRRVSEERIEAFMCERCEWEAIFSAWVLEAVVTFCSLMRMSLDREGRDSGGVDIMDAKSAE